MNMGRHHARLMVVCLGLLGLALAAADAGQSKATVAELARCAGIPVPDQRLACYDALAGVTPSQPQSAPAAAATRPITAAPDATAQPGPAPQSPAPQGTVPAQTATADMQDFGLAPRPLKVAPKGPESIKAVVDRLTEDRLGNVYVVLDDGQTWTFTDSDQQLRPGDSVTIKRAALGSFLMTTPSRRSYRVRRLQ
jgi:hypothetical protein